MRVLFLLALLLLPNRAGAATFTADDGVTLHYEIIGKGAPVVLLSGGPGFSPAYLKPVAEKLAGQNTFVVYHQRGTGLSAMGTIDAKTHALPRLVADLELLRKELKQEKLTLVAHSWGGILAMLYAEAHPDRVNALALVDSGGPTLQSVAKFASNIDARLTEEERAAVRLWSSPEKVNENRRRAVLELTRARTPAYFADRAHAEAFIRTLDETTLNDQVFWAVILQVPMTFDLRPAMKKLEAPVIVIHGRQDPLESADEVHAAFDGSKLEWVENAGHFPWLEQPERFYSLLAPFLAGATGAGGECH